MLPARPLKAVTPVLFSVSVPPRGTDPPPERPEPASTKKDEFCSIALLTPLFAILMVPVVVIGPPHKSCSGIDGDPSTSVVVQFGVEQQNAGLADSRNHTPYNLLAIIWITGPKISAVTGCGLADTHIVPGSCNPIKVAEDLAAMSYLNLRMARGRTGDNTEHA